MPIRLGSTRCVFPSGIPDGGTGRGETKTWMLSLVPLFRQLDAGQQIPLGEYKKALL